VRYAAFAGGLLFVPVVLGLDKPPFSVSGIVAGALLMVAGITVVSDGGEAMSALNQRYLGRSEGMSHVWFGVLMTTVGLGWLGISLWLTVR
jgi:hypothetical protein